MDADLPGRLVAGNTGGVTGKEDYTFSRGYRFRSHHAGIQRPTDGARLSSPPPLYAEVQRRLELFIRDRGLKQTRQRDEILEVFLGAESHLSVEELLRLVQVRMPGVGHATVYRTMKLLVDAGIAHEQQFRDGQLRYEPVIPNEHHDHLICLDCKRIFEFEDPVIEERQSQVAATHGLRLRSHRHEIYGSCNNPDSCPHRLAAP